MVLSRRGGLALRAFTDLTLVAEAEDCLEAEEATPAAVADDEGVYASPMGVDITTLIDPHTNDVPQTIVVAATDEDGDAVAVYEHLGLHTPDVIELRYRLYAVTDEDGDAETVDDRRISRAASETATGRTVHPSDKPDPRFESPPAVGNLRAVVYANALASDDGDDATRVLPDPGTGNQGLHFFWTHPDGYNPDYNDDEDLDDPNWYVQVQRRVAADADHDDYSGWQFVTGAAGTSPLATGYGTSQFIVDFNATLDTTNDPPEAWAAPVLWGDSKDNRHEYRVRYVNPGEDDDANQGGHQNTDPTDDVPGAWEDITIPQVTANYLRSPATGVPDADSTLPIILLSAAANAAPGLRFEYNDDDPRDHIDLLWTRNENAREGEEGPEGPHGYVIDRSPNGGATWETLLRADKPTELGTADTFTDGPSGDHEVVPGHRYTYRVFPAFIEDGPYAYGVPALIDANSQGAVLPTAARSVSADADGQKACVVTWRAPADDGGHPVRGYLIQIASDNDGDPGTWRTINIDGGTPPFTVMGGAMTEFKYTGTVAQLGSGNTAELTAGSVRWFRVIPVTNENDGNRDTGGAELDERGGGKTPHNPSDATSPAGLPVTDDYTRADPDKCTTEGLGDAQPDKVTAGPQMPVDLTVEAASDTNSLDPNDRGVFLTWNQQPTGDASKTTSYQINRIRMNTGVAALNDEADDWQFVKRVRDITSYTDSTDLRRDEETRMYQVCSEASGVADPVCVDMPVSYALHGAHEPDAPTGVMAVSSADGTMVTVSWTEPGSNGGSAVTGYTLQRAYMMAGDTMSEWMDVELANMGMDMMYMDTGLMPDTTYHYRVAAMNSVGMGEYSDGMAMAMTPAVSTEFTAPTSVAATSASGTITVTWMPGDLAASQVIVAVNASDDTDYCLYVDTSGTLARHECPNLTAGQTYVVLIIALDGQGGYELGNVVSHTAS